MNEIEIMITVDTYIEPAPDLAFAFSHGMMHLVSDIDFSGGRQVRLVALVNEITTPEWSTSEG